MRNDMADGGISRVIGRISQGVIKIIDEDEEQSLAQDTTSGHSSLDRERQ